VGLHVWLMTGDPMPFEEVVHFLQALEGPRAVDHRSWLGCLVATIG
jgi:hypothetical protein